jgi:WD40 repeat protein
MRLLSLVFLSLLCSLATLSQSKPVLQLKGELVFGDDKERIITDKFLAHENKLLLVGNKTIRVLDVSTAKFAESRPIDLADFSEDNPRIISPDGRYMLVFGNSYTRDKKDKIKRPASIWDLQTGKQVAVLDRTLKQVRTGLWSRNGQTLMTSSDRYGLHAIDNGSAEISFWDGQTFQYQSSLPATNINWTYLSADGTKCFYSVAPVLNLIIDKFIRFSGGPIRVWDTKSGKIEQTIPSSDAGTAVKVRGMSVSPDEQVLSFLVQPGKSKGSERRLAVWEIDRTNPTFELKARYEIKPDPKIYEWGVTFSTDGKYFANAGKNLQIYETRTGQKRFELPNVDRSPNFWLDDNRVLFFDYGSKMEALEMATGKQLYQHELINVWSSYSDSNDQQVNELIDKTTIIIHPNRNLLLTYSNQYVKVFDSLTGELLQTLLTPPMDYTKKKPRLSDKDLVSKAAWSSDGKTLYVISADGKSVSLWGLS